MLYFALLYYFAFTFVFVKPSINCRMRAMFFALFVLFYDYLLCGKLRQQAVVFTLFLLNIVVTKFFFMHFLCTADFCVSFFIFLFAPNYITLLYGASVWQQCARYFHASNCFRTTFACCCWWPQ